MAKLLVASLFTIALLLSFQLTTFAARTDFTNKTLQTQHHDSEAEARAVEDGEVSCEGIGKDECLMRRTLAAHVDYIYTQKQKP